MPRLVAPIVLILVFTHYEWSFAQQSTDPLTLEQIGIEATLGLREDQGTNAVFLKPLDAAFSGDRVLVLDASAPWIRVFDRRGSFVGAMGGRGGGPGEAQRPFSLSATEAGQVLLTHSTGLEVFTRDGQNTWTLRGDLRPTGAVEACGGMLAFKVAIGLSGPSAALLRIDLSGTVLDTLQSFEAPRTRARLYHPWFVVTTEEGLIIYTEEERRHRLLEVGCNGDVRREIVLPALGRGDSTSVDERLLRISAPVAPHAAGVAMLDGAVLWATRELGAGGAAADDLITVVRAYRDGGPVRSVTIRGWYQLFDSEPSGNLLFGNTWTLNQGWQAPMTWGLVPAVFIVDGRALVQRMVVSGGGGP